MQLFAGLCKACKGVQGRAKCAKNKTMAIFVESSCVRSCAKVCRPVQSCATSALSVQSVQSVQEIKLLFYAQLHVCRENYGKLHDFVKQVSVEFAALKGIKR